MNQNNGEWLTADFLAYSLQGDNRQRKITVLDFNSLSVVPPGNNYGSFIQRVKVDFKEENSTKDVQSLSLVVKAPLEDKKIRDMLEKLYICEPMFYNEYMPVAQKLINHYFIAKALPSSIHSVVVLEDLKEQGYVMVDKAKQLDFEHCLLYVTAAATFHAASFAVYKANPELVHSLGQEKIFLNDLGESCKTMTLDGLECMARCVSDVPGGDRYSKILKDCSATLWDSVVEAHKPTSGFNCLTQGDPWTTNMMFRYDDTGKVTDIKLVDFQALRYASPANDVVTFLWTSANHHVRKHALHDLYNIYVEKLNKNLKYFNCAEEITYEYFMDNVERISPWILSIAVSSLPHILNTAPVDIHSSITTPQNDKTRGESLMESCYNETFRVTHLPQVVEALAAEGVFEYLENSA